MYIVPLDRSHLALLKNSHNYEALNYQTKHFIDRDQYDQADPQTQSAMRCAAAWRCVELGQDRFDIRIPEIQDLVVIQPYFSDDFKAVSLMVRLTQRGIDALRWLDNGFIIQSWNAMPDIQATVEYYSEYLNRSMISANTVQTVVDMVDFPELQDLKDRVEKIKSTYLLFGTEWLSIQSFFVKHIQIYGKIIGTSQLDFMLNVKDPEIREKVKERIMMFKLSHEMEGNNYVIDPHDPFDFSV